MSGGGLPILAEGGKQLAEVPKLAAPKPLDHAPHREETNGPDLIGGRRDFIHRACWKAMDGGQSNHFATPMVKISLGIVDRFICRACWQAMGG